VMRSAVCVQVHPLQGKRRAFCEGNKTDGVARYTMPGYSKLQKLYPMLNDQIEF